MGALSIFSIHVLEGELLSWRRIRIEHHTWCVLFFMFVLCILLEQASLCKKPINIVHAHATPTPWNPSLSPGRSPGGGLGGLDAVAGQAPFSVSDLVRRRRLQCQGANDILELAASHISPLLAFAHNIHHSSRPRYLRRSIPRQ